MTSITHHLTEPVLISYAAGTLPEAFSLVVASHVSLCDACRARLETHEAVGGAVLEGAAAEMAAGGLGACLARLHTCPREPTPATPPARRKGILPAPVVDYVGGDLSTVRWRPLGMGVRQVILPTTKGATVRLLRIPAGVAVPEHSHGGLEMTLVLQGAFRDETARFGPGDVETTDQQDHHRPVAEEGVDCICLAATDAPLRFRGLLPRLLQPLFRI